jgi:phosphoenolpyruvate synthase/pyruvate phosphate dikinase
VLSDDEILDLARMAKTIEEHYGMPDGHGMGRTA